MKTKECQKTPKGTSLLESSPPQTLGVVLSFLNSQDIFHLLKASKFVDDWSLQIGSIDWFAISERESLPGADRASLLGHAAAWSSYRRDLFQALPRIVPNLKRNADLSLDKNRDLCKVFLACAVANFTERVSEAHSWYKHLPLVVGYYEFEFCLNLTSNMRSVGEGKFEEYREGDGTRFHYTWLPTRKYRERFGFFEYRLVSKAAKKSLTMEVRRTESKADDYSDCVFVPNSARGPKVSVTAVIHGAGSDSYREVLNHAVEMEQPDLVRGPITPIMLPHLQSRLGDQSKNGNVLPRGASEDLHRACQACLVAARHRDIDRDIDHLAGKAAAKQRDRERLAIASSLIELCRRVYGSELSPNIDDVLGTGILSLSSWASTRISI